MDSYAWLIFFAGMGVFAFIHMWGMVFIRKQVLQADMLENLSCHSGVIFNLVDVRRLENMQVFQGCLQHIFSMVKYNADKEKFYRYIRDHREEIQQMDHVEQMAALALLGEQKRLIQAMSGEESGEVKMCKAIDDLIEDGWLKGKAEGKAESVLLLLGDKGSVPAKLAERIRKENDSEILGKWLRLASRAESLEQFKKELQQISDPIG